MATASFAAGCFWGVESAFRRVQGVTATSVGYMGGHMADPNYRAVCTGQSGHAEAVRVDYDSAKVGYEQLLDVFWQSHDPTQVNRQGPDVGSQYRSAIFTHGEEQHAAALASKARLEGARRFRRPIATEIVAAGEFTPAEDYHQQYFEKRGLAPVCHLAAAR
jgi:peptide-methionine (S)-S-oxide reductase